MANNAERKLSQEQKIGFVFLVIFGLLAISLGALQLRNTIYGPFILKLSQTNEIPIIQDEQIRLQSIDTDHDGLNDYEELNFYQTSPYIPDTDSDGLDDKQEIDKGTDPLCPRGEDCSALTIGSSTSTEDLNFPGLDSGGLEMLGEIGGEIYNSGSDFESLIKDPQKLREVLIASGQISAEDLAKINDADLLKTVNEVLISEQVVRQATSTNNSISTSSAKQP